MYRLQQLLYVCVDVYAAFQANIVVYISGGSLRIELKAESRFIGCLSTIIVFMLESASASATSSTGFPDTLSSGDARSQSRSSMAAGRQNHETDTAVTGTVAHVIRKVKVYFEDECMAELRPTAPFRRPPRVSGKNAAVQVDGLPLER